MTKFIAGIVLVCLTSCLAFSQGLEWAHQTGGSFPDKCTSMVTDDRGNVYSTGTFCYTVDFDAGPGTTNLTATGLSDAYIQKKDPDGNLVWVKPIVGDSSVAATDIAIDGQGNLYLTGHFNDKTDFDPGPDTFNLVQTGLSDAFLLKIDNDGNLLWVKQFTCTLSAGGTGVAVSPSGVIYVAGIFKDSLDADPGTANSLLVGYSAVNWQSFIIKMDADGQFMWGEQLGTNNEAYIQTIALNHKGGLFTSGYFEQESDFNPGPGNSPLQSGGAEDVFIQKLDTNGNFIWARRMGGGGGDQAYDLKFDQSGNIVAAGFFHQTADFNPGPGVFNLVANDNLYADMFLVKLNFLGNFMWAKRWGGAKNDWMNSIDLDDSGNIYATGKFSSVVDFDPGTGTFNLTGVALNGSSAFVMKTDFLGNFVWARQVDGNSTGDIIRLDQQGYVHVAGTFQNTANMNPSADSIVFTALGYTDIFHLKLKQEWHFQGLVFYDANQNGIRDTLELFLKGTTVVARNHGIFTATDESGQYHFYDNIVGDTVQVIAPWAGWTVSPVFALADSAQTPTVFAAFGDYSPDVCIAAVESGPFRSGFRTQVILQVTNVGIVPLDSLPVKLKIVTQPSPAPLEFESAIPFPDAHTSDVFNWVIGPLGIYETIELRIFFRTPIGTPINTPITISAGVVLDDDTNQSNNGSRILAQTVGSFDPNDKQVTPASVEPVAIDTTNLRYVIRFQNTGNYPADFIVIRDTLSDLLDLSMLKMLAASHPYTWRIYGNRVLEFRFDNINLPDSTANEPESHGFVAFTVQAKNGLPLGTVVRNRAGIYFDYNEPVITNTSMMQVGTVVKTVEQDADEWLDFGLNPNPVAAFSRVKVDLPADITIGAKLTLIDAMGRVIQQISIPTGQKQVYLNGFPAGSYFVQLRSGSRMGGKVLIVE